jgi:hypothetical protein
MGYLSENPTRMKYFIPLIVAICLPVFAFCQDISGLWKGTMFNDVTNKSLPYEIFISKTGNKYSGYSYSWFTINGKEYYGVKKLKINIAKDGKIVVIDDALVDHNYPVTPDKNVRQLNVLDLAGTAEATTLNGPFETKRTKDYQELTGRINVKKVSLLTDSDLLAFLQKSGEVVSSR